MKLESLQLIFVLGLTGLFGLANGLCLLRNSTSLPRTYWYQCFKSENYLAELKRSPVDIFGHVVSNSEIQIIRNGTFTRFGRYLDSLAVLHCRVEDIEDKAFQGLTHLTALNLEGNKLQVIKSAWVKDLPNLKGAAFRNNRIKHIDQDFFSVLPPMEQLDISSNELNCLPTAYFGNFNASLFHYQHNPYTWMCKLSLMNWSQDIEFDEDCPGLIDIDVHYDLAKICLEKLPKSKLNEDSLRKCAEETSRGFLPTNGNYTVKQVCDYLMDKPSPFLNCTK